MNRDHQAIEELERLRKEHNGIMAIEVFMGHDGHNVVTLKSGDEILGKSNCGGDLYTAVLRAASAWRYKNLNETTWGHQTVNGAINICIKKFADGNIFTTAAFEQAINIDAYAKLLTGHCIQILESHPQVVRLKGGSHWFLLPDNHEKMLQDQHDESQLKPLAQDIFRELEDQYENIG